MKSLLHREAERKEAERAWKAEHAREANKRMYDEYIEERRREHEAGVKRAREAERQRQEEARAVKLQLKWRDASAMHYDERSLRVRFGRYGRVENVVVLRGKKDKFTGLVEMARKRDGVSAFHYEKGDPNCPIKVKLLDDSGKEVEDVPEPEMPEEPASAAAREEAAPRADLDAMASFEAEVMEKMRRAEERKRMLQEAEEAQKRETELEKEQQT